MPPDGAIGALHLVFTTQTQTLAAGQCSAVTQVQLQNGNGAPAKVTADTEVNITSTSAKGAIFTNSACSAVGLITMKNGTSSVTFYWHDLSAGTPTLRARMSGATDGTQAQAIRAAAASQIDFENSAVTATAGTCSPPIDAQARDQYGNGTTVPAQTTVMLMSTSPTMSFYLSPTCTTAVVNATTIPANMGAASKVYFLDTSPGTPTITLSATGYTSNAQIETVN